MWLTGFDVPSLHTMYIDKPMRGHGLMQTIARVNRVYKDKQGGLIVDYLGIADELKKAITNYTRNGGTGRATFDQDEAVAIMMEKYEIVCGIYSTVLIISDSLLPDEGEDANYIGRGRICASTK